MESKAESSDVAKSLPDSKESVPSPTVEYDTEKIKLKREYGLPSAISMVVGIIIGSGIFISPQGVLQNTGSIGLCMIVWLGGAVLSILGALTYTELISVVRKSGGDYSTLMKSMGPIPAFINLWSGEVNNAAGRAVQALSFASYMMAFFDNCGSPQVIKRFIATALIIFLTFTNTYSVRLTARVQVFFTTAKIVALVIIIGGGIYKISQGTVSELPTGFEGSVQSPASIALAFYSVMFAYGGWNNVNAIVEEIKRPRRNAPLASICGVIIVALLYILTNISYLAVLSKDEMLQSSAVAKTWGNKVLGPASWIIPVSVIMSVYGSANGTLGTGTRTMFVAARDGVWFEFLSFVHVKRYTPVPAIIVQVSVSIIMVWNGTITSLINFLGFTGFLMQGLASFSVFILRYRIRDDPHRIKIPLIIPILFSLWCCYLVIAPIVENPQIELLYAALFLVGGLVLYFPLFYFKLKPKFINTLEMYLQLFLEVAPGGYDSSFT